jgi:N-acetylated-alpha-linked acidic dipeptidase
MRYFIIVLLVSASLSAQTYTGFTPASAETQAQQEIDFLNQVKPADFKTHLKTLTQEPHIAGTPANEKVRDYMVTTMDKAGWSVDTYPYEVYMSSGPGTSLVEVVSPVSKILDQQEEALEEDPYSQNANLLKGWNAYSGSGDVTAEVIYANYGTKADFEKLEELGVSVKDKIVIARYGGNFRGYKAKFAEAHGAVGLIIYTDPQDSGFTRGLTFPEGVYYNPSAIQRGSLLTADWTGDPLTPYQPALPLDHKDTPERLAPEDAGLHTIPVTPIGYGAAESIFKYMKGEVVPQTWQGGLPYTYRVDGGKDLKVRLKVDQPKKMTKIYNVVATLKGKEQPDEWVILGCHYDAWAFGATDPNSGTAMLLSLSESLGRLAEAGKRPNRSIMIAHWDAEEHGVIGSSEWVEQMKDELKAKAVAYINLDGAVSGKTFRASSAPSLKTLIAGAAKAVDYPYTEESVYEHWAGEKPEPNIGNLGGGSDHIAFYMFAGVPSLSGGASGPTLYHTNYDDFYYYENFVDPEFQMGPMVEKLMGILSLRLANAELIPYDIERYATDLELHFENATQQVKSFYSDFTGFTASSQAISSLKLSTTSVAKALEKLLSTGNISKRQKNQLNAQLLALEKSFLDPKGMPYGDWYKSLYASSDPFSGYASWILPGIQYQIETEATQDLKMWDDRYAKAIKELDDKLKGMLESL